MDEELLSHPRPSTNLCSYTGQTLRMGTAKHDFCNSFYIIKKIFCFVKKSPTNLYMWVHCHSWK